MNRFKMWLRASGTLLLWATIAIALPAQNLHTVHSFDGTDGKNPSAGLLQGVNGSLYGTTRFGGEVAGNRCNSNCGTVFKIAPGRTPRKIYTFCSQSHCADGAVPYAGLVQGTDGNFYGTTALGGTNKDGTVFKVGPSGRQTTIYNFCSQTNCTDGQFPDAALVQGADGNIYGTTDEGGAGVGTVFTITPSGTLKTLYSFCSRGPAPCTDGAYPHAGLVQGAGGQLYGTTYGGGTYDYGTVFKITPSGTLTTLHSFESTDGAYPYAGLVQGIDGKFYGTTYGVGPTPPASRVVAQSSR
jgi:uncharacterized repeat protein (TIGR03803 family)